MFIIETFYSIFHINKMELHLVLYFILLLHPASPKTQVGKYIFKHIDNFVRFAYL